MIPQPPRPVPAKNASAEQPEPVSLLNTAHDVIRGMTREQPSLFAAPPLEKPDIFAEETALVPGVEAAFRPVNRLTETCAAEVEFRFGVHDITMVKTWPCESKQEEFRNAPGAERYPVEGNSFR